MSKGLSNRYRDRKLYWRAVVMGGLVVLMGVLIANNSKWILQRWYLHKARVGNPGDVVECIEKLSDIGYEKLPDILYEFVRRQDSNCQWYIEQLVKTGSRCVPVVGPGLRDLDRNIRSICAEIPKRLGVEAASALDVIIGGVRDRG